MKTRLKIKVWQEYVQDSENVWVKNRKCLNLKMVVVVGGWIKMSCWPC